MKIIAFDLGRTMAWAHNRARTITWGSATFEGARPERLGDFAAHLPALLNDRTNPYYDVLVYETPFARGLHATRSLWGIAGILEAEANNSRMAVVDVSVMTIKKFATGSGLAAKNDMIAAAKRWGYKGNNEHEADAICLLKYAEANLEKVLSK